MKEQIKELRIEIDGLAQLTKESNTDHIGGSKEMDKTVDSLYLAKAWLGKVLGELGNENPYGSGYKTKEDIVPTQDVSGATTSLHYFEWKEEKNHIEKVDWLRTEIEKVVNTIKALGRTQERSFTKEFNIARTNSYTHLCEARFWLGFEMERIKNN